MKIAFVSLMQGFSWGGSEELWFRTAKLALLKGEKVYTLTKKWPIKPIQIDQLNELGAHTAFYEQPNYSVSDRIQIKLKLKKYQTHLVPNVVADLYIISTGTTFDFIYYQNIIDTILKPGSRYILISQHNFESGSLVLGSQRDYGIKIIQNAIQFYFVSKRNLNTAQRQLAYPIAPAQVISNPVNISKPTIKTYPASPKLLMACVARLDCGFKGQDILLQALGDATWKQRDFSLEFYGTGPHLDHIQELISMYALQDKVTIEGHVNNIDQVWETNQVLVLPSLSEGTPLSLVEAMLSGRAALTTDVGDNEKYVIDGITGFLAKTASVKCLSTSLEDLWNRKETLKLLGETAFAHALQITDLQPEQTLIAEIQLAMNRMSS